MVDSQELKVYTLKNSQGLEVRITNFGGKIMSLIVPDRNGVMGDIVLGYDTPEQYISGNPYFGALIGRYGNRIAGGKFLIKETVHQLNLNNGRNSLHGGSNGFHNKVWSENQSDVSSLQLSLISPDGDENYPGELNTEVIYSLTEDNELAIEYKATTTKTTVVNLTNHAFFNLAGEGDILNHELKINANHFSPVKKGLLPIGEIRSLGETPFDFREIHTIGERINSHDEQLLLGKGYDHNYVLNKDGNQFSFAAMVREPSSGRIMEVWTTEPGLQFYSGNFLDGNDQGKNGNTHAFRSGFCLEAQHFPDSPNQPNFPSTLLNPGETYQQKTVYKFGVD